MKHGISSKPHVKERHRPVFLAAQADGRHYVGGMPAVAQQLGRNYGSIGNEYCPTTFNAQPTIGGFLDFIEITHAARTVQAVAMLAGMTAIPMPHGSSGTPSDVVAAFMHVVKEAGRVNERTAEALEDGRLDAQERADVGDYLDALIAAAVDMRALVRG